MAKKNIATKIDELNELIEKKMSGGNEGFDVFKKFRPADEFIHTGNYIINAQITGSLFGGIPNTRSMEICGPSGTGKSFFCLNIAREAQRLGYYVYYIDTEGAMEEEEFVRFGIDYVNSKLIRTINTYGKLRFFVNNIIEQKSKVEFEDQKIIVIVDSYGMLNTQKEIDDGKKGKQAADMGLRAKEGRQLFRNITLDLSNCRVPFVFTNHTGATLDMFAYEKEVPSGGGGPTYAASIILLVDKRPLKEGEGETKVKTGVIIRSKTFKNRMARPVEAIAHISFEKGMNAYVGLEKYIGWENCGIVRGVIMTDDEFTKKFKDGVAKNTTGKVLVSHKFENSKKETFYCIEKDNSTTWAVKDTCSNIPLEQFYTDKVFTQNVLHIMDDAVIKPTFRYKSIDEIMDDEVKELTLFIKALDEDMDESPVSAAIDNMVSIQENKKK